MGPILLCDKSFLESLTVNESVWLDNFFLTNIVPTFYVETLADLEKSGKKGKIHRTPEELVEEIAKKTPVMEIAPNVHYHRLLIGDLLGHEVDMSHRPIISGGEYKVSPDGKIGVSFKQFPESAALERWKKHEFLEIEKEVAKNWRDGLSNISFDNLIAQAKTVVPTDSHFSSMEDIFNFSEQYVVEKYNQLIHVAFKLLDIPEKARREIKKRWYSTRPQPFNKFAPYAAYVLKVNLFFYLCLDKTLIAPSHKGKQTNIVDLSYLYYLPFCMAFVSNDSLHKRIAPFFLDDNQVFVSGEELKSDLKKINDYFWPRRHEINKDGILKGASSLPVDIGLQVFPKIKEHFKNRKHIEQRDDSIKNPEAEEKLVEHLKKLRDEQRTCKGSNIPSDKVDSMQITRIVPVQRGDWRLVPEGIENKPVNS